MATPSTTVVNSQQKQGNGDPKNNHINSTNGKSERPLVCDVCWKRDGWMRDSKKNGLKLLRCKQCGVCVHAECYGWAEPLAQDNNDDEKLSEFCCWACLAVGTVVKVRERDPETGERKQVRITERPTECCLCSVDEGMEVPHAMHPMFDDYGLRARQILLPAEKGAVGRQPRPDRTAWAHSICCMVLSSSSGGVVYGLTRDGAFDGEDDNDDRIQDDESINSVLGDAKCKSAETITHFGHILDRFYKKGSLYLKNRKEYQSLKCIYCGANDQAKNVYRIPIQCAAGDKKEHADFHGCHSDLGTDACYQAMHVGCAFYGKNEFGEYPAVRRVYYFPGHQDDHVKHSKVVANCFCLKHAEDVSTLTGCGSTKYPKGSKKAPRLYNLQEESSKNAQSLLYLEGASEQMDPPPPPECTLRRRHSSAQSNIKPQSSQRRASHQQPLQSKRRHSQQQYHPQQHPKRSSETRAKNASNPSSSVSSLFFSNIETAAAAAPTTTHAGDSDFEMLVAELRNKTSKKDRTIMKKKWLRQMANLSSDKFIAWWERALEQSKEPCETTTTNSASSHADHHDGNHHLGEEHHLERPSNGGDETLKHEMIQAVSEAVAQLGDDKKKDPEVVRETVHERRAMFRKQQDSMSKADFNILWKDVRETVGQMHGIIIRPFKKRNSEQQQGTRKLPPDMANAIAAAAASTADTDAAGEPPMKKQKSQQHQQHQQQQVHVGTDGSMATGQKESLGGRKAAAATSTLATGIETTASSTSPTLQTRVESKNNDGVNDEKQAESSMDDEGPTEEPLTAEQIRFKKMVQDVDDESAAHRHQVPLQVILQKQRQQWEKHLVHEGPLHARLSDLEFASLWKRVEQRACENWQHRIQTATSAPMDWSFLVFGKHYDAKKATTYCNEWDTMNSDEI